ncbi:tetratricopeptide repeat protein [Sphingomonas sp. MMS24-JH45]
MALTPQNNEAFLREVDDELRREQAAALWRRWGRIAIVALVVALAAYGAWLFWRHEQNVAAEREGEQLQAAYDALGAGDVAAAAKPLVALTQSKSDGYRALATFTPGRHRAQQERLQGRRRAARQDRRRHVLPQPFRDLALVRRPRRSSTRSPRRW